MALGLIENRLTCAKGTAEVGDSACVGIRWASFVCAIANAKAKVLVTTEAGDVGPIGAAELLSLAQHVGDAYLLMEVVNLGLIGRMNKVLMGHSRRNLEAERWLQELQLQEFVRRQHEPEGRRLRCMIS